MKKRHNLFLEKYVDQKSRISPLWILILIACLSVSVLISPIISKKLRCNEVTSQYLESNVNFDRLNAQARSEWNSLPKLERETTNVGIWDDLYDKDLYADARDPFPKGGEFYLNFESFFQANYLKAANYESRIGSRIVTNNPECFDSRTVSENQDLLD